MVDHALNSTTLPIAASGGDLEILESRLEALENDPELQTLAELQTVAVDLAERYLWGKRAQEALWVLRRGELNEDAEYLEHKILQMLMSRPYVPVRLIKLTVSEISFGNYLSAIQKEPAMGEDAARIMDELLHIHRVPVHVWRPEGDRTHLIQFYIQDAVVTGLEFGFEELREDLSLVERLPYLDEVYPLDYLYGGADRNIDNSLWTAANRLVLIDHTERDDNFRNLVPPRTYQSAGGTINLKTLWYIHQVSKEELIARFTPLARRRATLPSLLSAFDHLKAVFPKPAFYRLDQGLSSDRRFDDFFITRGTPIDCGKFVIN